MGKGDVETDLVLGIRRIAREEIRKHEAEKIASPKPKAKTLREAARDLLAAEELGVAHEHWRSLEAALARADVEDGSLGDYMKRIQKLLKDRHMLTDDELIYQIHLLTNKALGL